MSLHSNPINAVNIKDAFSSFNKFSKILYVVNNIPVQRAAAKILETITSFAISFKKTAVSIGSNGVVIILMSLYGINPSVIALAVL